jgi:hypothetical protein
MTIRRKVIPLQASRRSASAARNVPLQNSRRQQRGEIIAALLFFG